MHLSMRLLTFATVAVFVGTQVSAQRCSSSDDCVADMEYCNGNVCAPIGSCTQRSDCFNPNNGPYPVMACIGLRDCINNQCGMTCGAQECPVADQRPAECLPESLPCDIETCDEADTCFNDPCGEDGVCTAVFYDAAGNTVCDNSTVPTQFNSTGPEPASISCTMDMDCEGVFNETLAYCSKGNCVQAGSCLEDVDCKNPSNLYAAIECVGVLQCDSNRCGRSCGPSFCPEGVEEVNCFADPCMGYETNCPIAASCVSDYCGGCSAILFDDAGNVIQDCNVNSSNVTSGIFQSSEASCFSDMDCAEDESEYCADGSCMIIGQCKDRIDCFNPANGPYAVTACVGLLDCTDGSCGVTCGPECPNGEERVPCPDLAACNITNCDEAVSCAFDGCGGECTEIFFDDAGTQVCVAVGPADSSCTSDADCTGIAVERASADGMYCAQGICKTKGECNDDLDCMNPSNIYPALDCVGYTSCEDGRCGVTCGPACKDGSDWSLCESSPCDNSTCATAASCANDLCNGCNAIFFDEAGNEVESCDPINFNTANEGDGAASTLSMFSWLLFSALFSSYLAFHS